VVLDAVGGRTFVDDLRRAWGAGDAVLPLDPRLPRPAADALLAALRPDEPVEDGDALVVATSGTTGAPRGVVLTHAALRASAVATSARLGVDPATDRWLACLPLAHVGGLSVVVRALLTDTPLTVVPGPDPTVVDAAGAAGHTLVSLVATALRRIDPTRWRRIVLGGSAPPDDVPANVVATYGMTETGSGIVYDGVALDGVEVTADATSELRVRAPMLARAYRDGTTLVDDEGWFATGDLGAVDPATGVVTVHGRRGDLIITGGENVWPDPVELVLATHPTVAEAAVVGRPDPEWGQRVVAVVVAADAAAPPTLAELRDHVRASLPTWCAPRSLELVAALPRTALGKVRRAEL
jgi:O-succinylbenzoic acid--CoA ligase